MGMLKVMIMPYVACSRLDRKVSSLILDFRFSQSHTLRSMNFFCHFFIIFSSFCIFVPLPLAAPVSRTAGREMKKK